MSQDYSGSFFREISDFCRMRLAAILPPIEVDRIRAFIVELFDRQAYPPFGKDGLNWLEIAEACAIESDRILFVSLELQPAFDILVREVTRHQANLGSTTTGEMGRHQKSRLQPADADPTLGPGPPAGVDAGIGKPRQPKSATKKWKDPIAFSAALTLQMRRHGESAVALHSAIVEPRETFNVSTIRKWRSGECVPQSVTSLEMLARIERRYELPIGYFAAKLPATTAAPQGHKLTEFGAAERSRIAWHLPPNFGQLPRHQKEEILDWVRNTILRGATAYRRYQADATKHPFLIRFQHPPRGGVSLAAGRAILDRGRGTAETLSLSRAKDAPAELQEEINDLVRFKTSALTPAGFDRIGTWCERTTTARLQHLGLVLGAMAAAPNGPARGLGMPLAHITLALLVFPSFWDWYLGWREARRGFYNQWEVKMLQLGMSLTRPLTGWLRQHPELALRLRPFDGMLSQKEILGAQESWAASCDAFRTHAGVRIYQVRAVMRVHRDPFEAILPVLESESPVGEYSKIADEILRRMPNEDTYPTAAAGAVRSFLMIRFGLHLGLRQRNLRELQICPIGSAECTEQELTVARRGELRWKAATGTWEVFIPTAAFKNSNSTYFMNKPFRAVLPDLGGLYRYMGQYLKKHRAVLLKGAPDPGTFFVKSMRQARGNAAYDQDAFYENWRLIIQRYGIHNPYTGRGAIRGLLPHGPHSVRDILATHVLKKTGSFEQASYAIQDTPETVAQHYGRFLPYDKAAIAANIVNQVWKGEFAGPGESGSE